MEDGPDANGSARPPSEPSAPLPPSPAKPLSDKAAARAAYRRYKKTWDLAHLDKAIHLYQRAIDAAPEPDAYLLGQLGQCLGIRYRNQGKLDDLERGIAAEQEALQLIPDEHPDKALRLNNLGVSLRRRYERLGELDDLKSAMTMQQRSVELTPADHPNLSAYLDNLGYLYDLRYQRFGELHDLECCIANHKRAVDLKPDDHRDKPIRLNNLGLSLRRRSERLGEPDDFERAMTVQRRAVELAPEDHPNMPGLLDNLGSLQWLRYERFGNLEDLEHAIAGQQRAVGLTPDGHPVKPTCLHNLGVSLQAYFDREKTAQRFNEVISCFISATADLLESPSSYLQTAQYTVKLLTENPEFTTSATLILAYSRVVDILPEIAWLGHSLTRRLDESKHFGELVNGAVCAAIGAGALEQAAEWLEAGRGLIWTQALSLRSPIDDLERVHPKLAHPLRGVLAELQNTVHASSHRAAATVVDRNALPISSTVTEGDRHRGLAIEYGKLISEVRRHSGFENFMLPKKLAALLPSSTSLNGPIIFLNLDRVRCAAVILSPDGTITTVTLQELSLDRARRMWVLWLGYLQRRDVRQRMATCVRSSSEDVVVARVLGRIWKWIVDPVLKALKISKRSRQDRLPHITWCPTGQLTQLPIHAAGIYDEECGPRLYNLAVSSYTPSLSTLTRSINAAVKSRANPSVLIVTQPKTPGLAPLPGTIIERTRLVNVLSKFDVGSATLMGGEASIDTIRGALKVHPWLHLACHGCQDTSDPLKSAFALEGGYLTLSDLMTTVSDHAELAFLSACQTAVGDEKIPEESMHLAAGMLAVGFKGVIATMWSIRDNDAPLVVEEYYKVLLELRALGKVGEGETGAAYALHEATRRLREIVGDREYMRWAPFVHFGI